MDWININTRMLRSPEFIGSEPVARATWLCLLGYCVDQENGGRIKGGAAWKDRQWQQAAGVTTAEVLDAAPLIIVDGEDVLVHGYPAEKEAEVRAKRAAGQAGGKQSGRARRSRSEADLKQNRSSASSTIEAQLQAPDEAEVKQNRRERKGKEGKGTEDERKTRARSSSPSDPNPGQQLDSAMDDVEANAPPVTIAKPSRHADHDWHIWRQGHPQIYVARTGDDGDLRSWQALYDRQAGADGQEPEFDGDPMSVAYDRILEAKRAERADAKVFLGDMLETFDKWREVIRSEKSAANGVINA